MEYNIDDKVVIFSSIEECKKALGVQYISTESERFLKEYSGAHGIIVNHCLNMRDIRFGSKVITINTNMIKDYYRNQLSEKPPLGLILLKYFDEATNDGRVKDIIGAMTRYSEKDKVIPLEWISELYGRIATIQERK